MLSLNSLPRETAGARPSGWSISLALIALLVLPAYLQADKSSKLELTQSRIDRIKAQALKNAAGHQLNNNCISPSPGVKHGPEVRNLFQQANLEQQCMKYGNCKMRYATSCSLSSSKSKEYKRAALHIQQNRETAVEESEKLIRSWTDELKFVDEQIKHYKNVANPQRMALVCKRDQINYSLTYAYFLRAEALRQSARSVEAIIVLHHLKVMRRSQRGIPVEKIANLENQVVGLIVFTFQQDLYKLLNIEATEDLEEIKAAHKNLSDRLAASRPDQELDLKTDLCQLVSDLLDVAYDQLVGWIKAPQRDMSRRKACYVFYDISF